jgi:hypothetical protein
MIVDLLHVFLAALIFVVVMAGAVYWLCSATGFFDFSREEPLVRLSLVVVLSIALVPETFYLLARAGGFPALYSLLGLSIAASFLFCIRDSRRQPANLSESVPRKKLLFFCVIFLLIMAASLIDLSWGHHVYFSTVAYDWTGRVAITQAVTDSGVPPVNPSFYPGHALPLFYYYFWFLVCSVCERLSFGLVDSRQVLIAGSFYAALGLIAIVCVFSRYGNGGKDKQFGRRWRIGALLLLVTGLDIVPWALRNLLAALVHHGYKLTEIESWNSQVTAWTGAVLWVPNHIAGFVAAAFVLLMVEYAAQVRPRQVWLITLLCGITIPAVFGMSVWIGLMLVLILAVWFFFAIWRKWFRDGWIVAVAGIVSGILFLPYYLDLTAARHTHDRAIRLEVRHFLPLEDIFRGLHMSNPVLAGIAYLLVLPLNYFLELGFFAVIGVLAFRKFRVSGQVSREQWLRIITLAVSVVVCTFVRSNLQNNDLGWRCFMYAQMVLLLWGIDFVVNGWLTWRTNIGRLLLITLVLGVMGSAADLLMLRFSSVVADAFTPRGQIAESVRNYEERQAYRVIDARYPKTLFVQHNPLIELDYYNSLFGLRPVEVADENYAFLYGIDRAWANAYVHRIAQPFLHDMPDGIRGFCAANGIVALDVRDTDPVWQDRNSWVWRLKPIFANDVTRVFDCR